MGHGGWPISKLEGAGQGEGGDETAQGHIHTYVR
jgi:hypothetical protein